MDKATRFISRNSSELAIAFGIAVVCCSFWMIIYQTQVVHPKERAEELRKEKLENERIYEQGRRRLELQNERSRAIWGPFEPGDRSLKEINEELQRLNDHR